MKLDQNMRNLISFIDADGVSILRGRAHAVFDQLWKEDYMTRTEAYKWLADQMQLPKKKAHISLFNADQCYTVICLVEEELGLRDPLDVSWWEMFE